MKQDAVEWLNSSPDSEWAQEVASIGNASRQAAIYRYNPQVPEVPLQQTFLCLINGLALKLL
ncbi:MAG: hypothetical protein B0W54_17530 [Cellvibrio sp. 79]|nr:MAG: hypothetical protein B0W54_17530 [Cellvibrio sp. 79]